jgi:phosphoglycolate phosphatase-like HAD superfamily hydrolase
MSEMFHGFKSWGASLYVASSAPKQKYLDHFLKRVPDDTFVDVLGYRSGSAVAGLSHRARVKFAQLKDIQARHPGANILFVGDDGDDAAAAAAAGVSFVHACWGGRCASVSGAHGKSPASMLAALAADKD